MLTNVTNATNVMYFPSGRVEKFTDEELLFLIKELGWYVKKNRDIEAVLSEALGEFVDDRKS